MHVVWSEPVDLFQIDNQYKNTTACSWTLRQITLFILRPLSKRMYVLSAESDVYIAVDMEKRCHSPLQGKSNKTYKPTLSSAKNINKIKISNPFGLVNLFSKH